MVKLIGYEFKKLWTQAAKVCILSLVILTFVLSMLFFIDYPKSIISSGEEMSGLKGVRVVEKEGSLLAGEINQDYLDKLKQSYNESSEKEILGENLGGYIHKYEINPFLNFALLGDEASNYDLDLDWLTTEANFYHRYQSAVFDSIKAENEREWSGTNFQYTDAELKRIEERIQKMKVPFKVTSTTSHGTGNLINSHGQYYWIVFVAIVFCLSGIFSKDSNSGLDELSLAARHGRKKSMDAKLIAGNLFATMIYFIYVILLVVINGLTMSISGLGNSIQLLWPTCVYSMSALGGMLILFFIGWLTALVIANIAMLISIKTRYMGLSTLAAILLVFFLKYMTNTAQVSKLALNPLYFVTHFSSGFDTFYFIGKWMIPYTAISVILGSGVILLVTILTRLSYKTYRIN